jgi:chromosome segregation protein
LDRADWARCVLIIGQGLVDQVLSLRPKERLALFEQAAGIAPYRNRREDAVHRLDETQHNLERVYDILSEIEPRLRRLKRQAERAEQHIALTKELMETLRVWYGYRWSHAVADLEQARHSASLPGKAGFAAHESSDKVTTNILALRQQSPNCAPPWPTCTGKAARSTPRRSVASANWPSRANISGSWNVRQEESAPR